MTKRDAMGKQLRELRGHLHDLSGVLTGASAGVSSAQTRPDLASATPLIVGAESLLDEAHTQVAAIRSLVRDLERLLSTDD